MGYIFGYWTLGDYLDYLYMYFYVVNLVIVGIFNLEKQVGYIVTCWTCFCFITFLLLQGVDLDMYRYIYIYTYYIRAFNYNICRHKCIDCIDMIAC